MIMDGNADGIASLDDHKCHINVGLAGCWVAAGVIMGEDDGASF